MPKISKKRKIFFSFGEDDISKLEPFSPQVAGDYYTQKKQREKIFSEHTPTIHVETSWSKSLHPQTLFHFLFAVHTCFKTKNQKKKKISYFSNCE